MAGEVVSKYLLKWRASHPLIQPLIVGIQGPQGIGKTTLVNKVKEQLSQHNLNTVFMSLDDFYLTFEQQKELAKQGNPLTEFRGCAGTHSIDLGIETLNQLKQNHQTTNPVLIPIYDKSLNHGRGDRLPQENWLKVYPPFDVILLEGWMLGFTPVPSQSIQDKNMIQVNENLKNYQQWFSMIDYFIQLKVEDLSQVYLWRSEAERKMKKLKGFSMTDEEVRDFIDRFMTSYSLYLPQLDKTPFKPRKHVTITIDKDRNVQNVEDR